MLCLLAWAMQVRGMLEHGPWSSFDSHVYIECARSLDSGHGTLRRPSMFFAGAEWEPISLWPPGYPWLIAGVMKLAEATTMFTGRLPNAMGSNG